MILDTAWRELCVSTGHIDLEDLICALQRDHNSTEENVSTRNTVQDSMLEHSAAQLVDHATRKYDESKIFFADKKQLEDLIRESGTKLIHQLMIGC